MADWGHLDEEHGEMSFHGDFTTSHLAGHVVRPVFSVKAGDRTAQQGAGRPVTPGLTKDRTPFSIYS